ncbi:MAG: 3-hydroxyacyl-CoA dehydrogenase/enoyl-CoA hydratase family protein [Rectinemataceae bacterium]
MRQIQKAAVLGSGVMGATIAAHLANAGIRVLLMDMVPRELAAAAVGAAATAAGAGTGDRAARNSLALAGLEGLKKMSPAAFFVPSYASFIEVGNFDDDAARLKECDWVIEVVIENLDIKKGLFLNTVVPNMREGAILSTNTSGLSVNEMAAVLPPELRKRFLATHFFNPPRYMRLLEIVPCSGTDPEVLDFMSDFIARRLGKGIVFAKDTPNFIANRIGVYSIASAIRHMVEMDMNVEEVDAVAGPATGRPKSAAFGTTDLVGIDTMMHVANNSYELLATDDERGIFRLPAFVADMVGKGLLGRKAKQGFFRRDKGPEGTKYFYYDWKTGEYLPSGRPKFASVEAAKPIEEAGKRIKALIEGSDKAADFAWRNLRDSLIYTWKHASEIAEDVVNIDNGMRWGFNWDLGPFEMLDAIGLGYFVGRAEKDGVKVPEDLKAIGSFYRLEGAQRQYWCFRSKAWKDVPGDASRVSLQASRRAGRVVEKSAAGSVHDLGDGVFCLEYHSKMNAIGGDTLSLIHKALKRAGEEGVGLVIANEGQVFSAGANLMLMAMAIAEGSFDEISMTIKAFQKAMMAIKYSPIPVVAAPHNLALGGGCETCLHADGVVASAETYMGLVELGVGLIPGGGGTKEMAIRAITMADRYETDVQPFILKNFMNIAMARVSMSAAELFDMGFMRQGDGISMDPDRRIHDAKLRVLSLAATYRPGSPLVDLKAPGRSIAATIKSQIWSMRMGGFVSEYDQLLAGVASDVITGGDVPGGTLITEEYLLELEREGFLKLCGQKKTLERIQHMLKKGKPLRN